MSAIRSWINCGSNDVPAGAWCARARRVDATDEIRGRMVVKMEELNMAFYDVYKKELLVLVLDIATTCFWIYKEAKENWQMSIKK